eukprot:2657165-Amphidinium_carterae.1
MGHSGERRLHRKDHPQRVCTHIEIARTQHRRLVVPLEDMVTTDSTVLGLVGVSIALPFLSAEASCAAFAGRLPHPCREPCVAREEVAQILKCIG